MTTAMTPSSPPEPPFDPDDDDRLIGRVLSRREVLALMGAGGPSAVAVAACAPGSSAIAGAPRGSAGAHGAAAAAPRRPPRPPRSRAPCRRASSSRS